MSRRSGSWIAGLGGLAALALAVHGWRSVAAAPFHAGLLLGAAAGVALSLQPWLSRRPAARFLVATLACLMLGVVAVDRIWLSRQSADAGEAASYSFVAAAGRPEAFVRWHARAAKEGRQLQNTMPDPRGVNPYVLKPGRGGQFGSTWWVNALGFRGREIPREKGNHYRIVALGESTTFGETFRAEDRPWPEILEQRIAEQLACEKPVEVINAGVPGFTLANNLSRLAGDVFPLEPDLIVSYHGYNGFPYILREIPSARVGTAPEAPPRPSHLVARVETALRLWWFRRRYRAAREVDERALEMDVQLSRYAELYRELVFETRERGIALALCSFNMAVTSQSPEAVLRFYEPVFPDLRARILANRLHTRLVRQLAERYGALFIDTSAGLDGAYEDAYVDPIHFTELGRERLAAHVLAGLRERLAAPSPGCRPRGR